MTYFKCGFIVFKFLLSDPADKDAMATRAVGQSMFKCVLKINGKSEVRKLMSCI